VGLWNTRSRLTVSGSHEYLSCSLGARAKERRDILRGLHIDVQRHVLELKRQGGEGMEEFTTTQTPMPKTRGTKELETSSEARRGNVLDDPIVVVFPQPMNWSAFPPPAGRNR
jgi:hypothetical protein